MAAKRDTTAATEAHQRLAARRLMAALNAIRSADPKMKLSASELARRLNAAGTATRRGTGKWSARAVLDLRPQLGEGFKRPQHVRLTMKARAKAKAKAEELDRWPDGAVRYSKRLNAYIMADGRAVRATGTRRGKELTTKSANREDAMRRARRAYTEKLRGEGSLPPVPAKGLTAQDALRRLRKRESATGARAKAVANREPP